MCSTQSFPKLFIITVDYRPFIVFSVINDFPPLAGKLFSDCVLKHPNLKTTTLLPSCRRAMYSLCLWREETLQNVIQINDFLLYFLHFRDFLLEQPGKRGPQPTTVFDLNCILPSRRRRLCTSGWS